MRVLNTAAGALVAVVLLAGPVGPAGSVDLPRRAMNESVVLNAKGWLIFSGDVEPGWNKKNVQIYKKVCLACDFTLVKKVRTDGHGRWRTRVYAPASGYWYWKGVVPKSGDYGKSVTKVWRTFVV